jgi:hypothetical protein
MGIVTLISADELAGLLLEAAADRELPDRGTVSWSNTAATRALLASTAMLDADMRENARLPTTWIGGAEHAVCGVEIPYLPEPFTADLSRSTRNEAARQHRRRFHDQFARIIHALYVPAFYRERGDEWNVGHHVFDLRIVNSAVGGGRNAASTGHGTGIAATRAQIVILVRVGVQKPYGDRGAARARVQAIDYALTACQRIRALAPRELTIRDIHWHSDLENGPTPSASRRSTECWLTPAQAGLADDAILSHFAEIRRSYQLTALAPPDRRVEYLERVLAPKEQANDATSDESEITDGRLRATPYPWPTAECDYLATIAALTATSAPAILSIRLRPTAKTALEIGAIIRRFRELQRMSSDDADREPVLHLLTIGLQEELFQAAVQVAAGDAETVRRIAQTYIGEQTLDQPVAPINSLRRLAIVSPLSTDERSIAARNLAAMEFIPWGAIDNSVQERQLPNGNPPDGVRVQAYVTQPNLLDKPEIFLARDAERNSALARLRSLVTLDEAARLWRLPVVEPGGQAGILSRLPNPFEQLPEETPDDGDSIVVGEVQHRGRPTGQHFRLPLIRKRNAADLAGVGDRVFIVAGSPGSGKTNFCLAFLGQLWDRREPNSRSGKERARYPYLVVDPTRGNEFRRLRQYAGDDLVVFTVGDSRCSPFRFNPFIVPLDVSIQTHISRIMSCFRAAYHMWDPLPAIFEMALHRAYEVRRRRVWQKHHPDQPWTAAEDFPAVAAEPFPNLDDLIGAMGRGVPDEKWEADGRPTIMTEQREMWGGVTENAATIVASTFLRLQNLRQNFGHILGVGHSKEPLIDVRKLLDHPVIMEMGMVGDSQALSLIMGFLLICLRGNIETKGPQQRAVRRVGAKQSSKTDDGWMHLLVIEEAHLLLSAESGGGGSREGGNSKAQAAEDINNMLAEVRKYGQGVMLLDQRPGSLVGGAIDNAFVVCMHRLNEEKSFAQFSLLLNLTPDQQRFARTELRPGEMITLDRRSGLPVLVRPENERTDLQEWTDVEMRETMLIRRRELTLDDPGSARTEMIEAAILAQELENDVRKLAKILEPISPADQIADAIQIRVLEVTRGLNAKLERGGIGRDALPSITEMLAFVCKRHRLPPELAVSVAAAVDRPKRTA